MCLSIILEFSLEALATNHEGTQSSSFLGLSVVVCWISVTKVWVAFLLGLLVFQTWRGGFEEASVSTSSNKFSPTKGTRSTTFCVALRATWGSCS